LCVFYYSPSRRWRACGFSKTGVVEATTLTEMCRASPLLTRLNASGPNLSQHLNSDLNMDAFAITVSTACPLLEDVALPTIGPRSRAESYQMHFPRTRCVSLSGGSSGFPYQPTRWDKIEASARQCEHAGELDLMGCSITSELAGLLLRGNLQRVACLTLEGDSTDIEPATILQLAAGLEAMSELGLPEYFNHTVVFYSSLARARPSLKMIFFGEENSSSLDDACVAAICDLALERLIIDNNQTLTTGIVDTILASRAAQTLSDLSFSMVDAFTPANMLRLARGCPKLVDLIWHMDGMSPLSDGNGQNVDDLTVLLESRAKQISEDAYFELDVFAEFGPWKPTIYHYRNTVHSQHPPGL